MQQFLFVKLVLLMVFAVLVLSFSIISNAEAQNYKVKKIILKKIKLPDYKKADANQSKIGKPEKPPLPGKFIKPTIKKANGKSGQTSNTSKSPFITIELSNTCLRLIKNNMTARCPTYTELIKFDNTNQKISGSFINDTWYHREKPYIINHDLMYTDSSKTIICVDCSKAVMMKAKNIIIEASSFIYKLGSDSHITNNTRHQYSMRYVDGCSEARLAWSDWLLNDTINYLKSGCTKTQFKEKETIYKTYTKFDITTSQAYKNQKWIEEAKKLSKTNCIKSTEC